MATRFYLDKRTNKAGESAVKISVSMYKKRILTTLGFSVEASKWNEARQRIKHGATVELKTEKKGYPKRKVSYSDINNFMNSIENYFTELEMRLRTVPEAQKELDLMAEFNSNFRKQKYTNQRENTLFDRIDEFVREESKLNEWTDATGKLFRALKNHLTDFDGELNFNDLNENGLFAFIDYLRKIPLPNGQTGMRNSTIKKHLSYLKWFLRWTIKKGYNSNTDFINFNPKLKTVKRQIVFLEWNELLHVYNFKFTGKGAKRLEQVKDVFCFLCFTGLRYSDIVNLKLTDISEDAITITTQKTTDTVTIELNDYSKAILEKYKDEDYPYNNALPVISNQKMNNYLKEMAEICGLDDPITDVYFKGTERIEIVRPKYQLIGTHAGRRTFISNALMKGIPVNVVMRWTGHSDYEAMQPYIAIAESTKKEAMKLFNT